MDLLLGIEQALMLHLIILLHAHVGLASCDQCLAVVFAWEVVGPHQIIEFDVDSHNYRSCTCNGST